MSRPGAQMLQLKNTFFEVHLPDAMSGSEDEQDKCPHASPKATHAAPNRSPTSVRARSAEACSPARLTLEERSSPQVHRLNSLLACQLRPSFALDLGSPEPSLAASPSGAASTADSEEAPPKLGGLLRRQPWSYSTESTATSLSDRGIPSDHGVGGYCHQQVPRNLDLGAAHAGTKAGVTTLMIRNIPNRYKQGDLQADLRESGFEGCFDFLYLPVDKASKASVGYAFVNFVDATSAAKCMAALDGHLFQRHGGKPKEAKVSAAHLQGLEANLAHYARSTGKVGEVWQRPAARA